LLSSLCLNSIADYTTLNKYIPGTEEILGLMIFKDNTTEGKENDRYTFTPFHYTKDRNKYINADS
jgi:hypothetical protein